MKRALIFAAGLALAACGSTPTHFDGTGGGTGGVNGQGTTAGGSSGTTTGGTTTGGTTTGSSGSGGGTGTPVRGSMTASLAYSLQSVGYSAADGNVTITAEQSVVSCGQLGNHSSAGAFLVLAVVGSADGGPPAGSYAVGGAPGAQLTFGLNYGDGGYEIDDTEVSGYIELDGSATGSPPLTGTFSIQGGGAGGPYTFGGSFSANLCP